MASLRDFREICLEMNFDRRWLGILQPPFEKAVNLFVRLLCGRMAIAARHGNTIVAAEHLVDGNRVVESGPALRQVGSSAGDEKWPRRHERMQFHQIMSVLENPEQPTSK